jgi:ABC-type dipeptide/oligopeptide/nickel transport system permease component
MNTHSIAGLTVALLSLFIYLLLDIIHAYLDPRVQY